MHRFLPPVCRTLLVGLACLFAHSAAFAYIDPNAGGMLFQLLAPVLAAIVGGWLMVRRWLGQLIKRWFRRGLGKDSE